VLRFATRARLSRMGVVGAALVAAVAAGASPAAAQPASSAGTSSDAIVRTGKLFALPVSADGSHIASYTIVNDRNIALHVFSAAMNQDILVNVQRPADPSAPRPTLYLLNGDGGGQDAATWVHKAPVVLRFLATKNVNVIQPVGGMNSYYTDWRRPDPALGVNKWRTFFTEELPGIVDGALDTDRRNAIAGLSSSGTSVLQLAEAAPQLYGAVASYSGCAQISDPVGHTFVDLAVSYPGGPGDTDNMYGPYGDPMWRENDPYVHADKLRGIDLFIASGTGLPGEYDTLNNPYALPGVAGLVNQIIVGGAIEAGVDYCTHRFRAKLDSLGIPATYYFPPTGTHSWGYWRNDFPRSWPVLATGLGLPV
jgi:diacylglycerol O-acyltransferase / trehalose O-mycolyltransferase